MNALQDISRQNYSIRNFFFWLDFYRYRILRKGEVPKYAKYRLIRKLVLAFGIEIVVETGTYLGDFIQWMLRCNRVKCIHSVEISQILFERAKRRFRDKRICLYLGDSRKVLPTILEHIDRPTLFWLDAHFSGGITSGEINNPPIREELDLLIEHIVRTGLNHLIIVDDAKYFVTAEKFPSIAQVDELIKKELPLYRCKVCHDMIILHGSQTEIPC